MCFQYDKPPDILGSHTALFPAAGTTEDNMPSRPSGSLTTALRKEREISSIAFKFNVFYDSSVFKSDVTLFRCLNGRRVFFRVIAADDCAVF